MKLAPRVKDTPPAPLPDTIRWNWGLDVLMAVAILVALYVLASGNWRVAQFKAKATEQLITSSAWRSTLIEHYALTGEWQVTGGNVPRDFAAAADAMKWQSGYSAVGGILDGVIVTLGRYPGFFDGVAILTFRPAVAKGQEQPTVRWFCGHAVTPPGWEGPNVSPATNLPDDYLYSLCRR